MQDSNIPIKFDAHGNPFPYQLINIDMGRFRTIFTNIPDKAVRLALLKKLIKYIDDFHGVMSPKNWTQWFGGSYITNKLNPNDIDLVNFIDSVSAEAAIART